MSRSIRQDGWTGRTVITALAVAFLVMAVALVFTHLGLWPSVGWSQLAVGAVSGTLYLALKHLESRLLAIFVFLPVCVFFLVIFGSTVALPIERLFR